MNNSGQFIVMIPPDFVDVFSELRAIMKRYGYTLYEEIEERAGCRCFILSNPTAV